MFLKVISLFPLFLAITFGELAALDCGNKDVAACKVEFVKQLDIKFRDHGIQMTKRQVDYMVNVFEMALKEIPDESENAKLLKDSIKSLKEGMAKIEANKDDYAMMRHITTDIERHMQPEFTFAPPDKKSIPELEKLLEKYNASKVMEEFDFNEIMATFGKFWQDTYAGLRPSDLKAYPEYNAINDISKKLARHLVEADFNKIAREFLTEMRKFIKIPSLEILIFADRDAQAGKKNSF